MRFLPYWLKVFLTILIGNAMVTAIRHELYDGTGFDMVTRIVTCVALFYVAWRASFLTDSRRSYLAGVLTGTFTFGLGAVALGIAFNKKGLGATSLVVSVTMYTMAALTMFLRQRRAEREISIPILTLPGNPDVRTWFCAWLAMVRGVKAESIGDTTPISAKEAYAGISAWQMQAPQIIYCPDITEINSVAAFVSFLEKERSSAV